MDKGTRRAATQETSGKTKSSFMNPGMEHGAGDSPSATSAQNPTNEADLATLQDHLAKLRLPRSVHGSGDDGDSEEVEMDHDEACSTEDSEGEIEPLCSYPYGYIKRQTVYICVTCNDPTKEDWKPAGVCIGCRHACHQGHEVISMETRRNFRCDCGNKKFPEGTQCLLCPKKEEINELNVYNNNYKGTFCTCNCKESDCVEEDPLYQCVVCEDWYHASHCNVKTDGIEKNYTDLVCGDCTAKLDFLRYYDPFDPTVVVNEEAIEEMMKYTDGDEDEDEENNNKQGEITCKLTTLVKKDPFQTGHLWTLGWRGKLCRCVSCKELYSTLNVSFLLDKEDETRRYFDDEEDDTQMKICGAIQRFEEWLLQMNASERDEMFSAGPEMVKQKMKEHFANLAENQTDAGMGDDLNEFLSDDQLLDQLLQAFTEFILEADGGSDYLLDVDALKSVFNAAGLSGEHSQDENDQESAGEGEAAPGGQETDDN